MVSNLSGEEEEQDDNCADDNEKRFGQIFKHVMSVLVDVGFLC